MLQEGNANQQCPFELAVGDVANPRRAFDVLTELTHALSPERNVSMILRHLSAEFCVVSRRSAPS